MGYSETWEKLINEKNLKSKISCHCPFKSREMIGRSQTLLWWLGEGGTKTEKNTLDPLNK
jgi:hypothetical protein